MRVQNGSPEGGFVRALEDESRKGLPARSRDVSVADRQRRAEHLSHDEFCVRGVGHLGTAVKPDTKTITEFVNLVRVERLELLGDSLEAFRGAQGVTVAHRPQPLLRVVER